MKTFHRGFMIYSFLFTIICSTVSSGVKYPDWLAEARIYGLAVAGVKIDPMQLNIELDRAIAQGANVIEADSRLSDYLTDEEYATELRRISATNKIIHERGLKVVWYYPAIEVITPYGRKRKNGRYRQSSMFRTHPDWVQLAFDGDHRSVFYGQKVFWVDKNDESAWMCPNSPYREWFKNRLRLLAKTGTDGIWLDVPLMGLNEAKWGCADKYCREKFTRQTGMEFPNKFDISDKIFWRYLQWRHETLKEFLEDCASAASEANQNTETIVEVVSLDQLASHTYGLEGSLLNNVFIVWEADGASEHTAMADASYDDWIAQYGIYKYCRGATADRPSWIFSYGFNKPDAQLVMAGSIAAQNNPYETRTPRMTNSVSIKFRGRMYNWLANYSQQIFRSKSEAPVAILYSPRNRDFLDAMFFGGVIITENPPKRDRGWLGKKGQSPVDMEYLGDYRGLSLLLYQHQIPTDIFPINQVNEELLSNYKALVLPYMAMLNEHEQQMLLHAVDNGATLIVTGPEAGEWQSDGKRRQQSLWANAFGQFEGKRFSQNYGKGHVHFWRDEIGRRYLKNHDKKVADQVLLWLHETEIEPWINEKLRVVVQPYRYENQIIIHVLNYSWVGKITNKPNRISLTLSIPWDSGREIENVTQSEPGWESTKSLTFSQQHGKLQIPLEVGINCMVLIKLKY